MKTNVTMGEVGGKPCSGNYPTSYNDLLSEVAMEFGNKFPAIANPTLSKQETVTYLYNSIAACQISQQRLGFPWQGLFQFIPRILLTFIRLAFASLRFRVKQLPENCVYFRTWLVPKSLKDGAVVDDYFRDLSGDVSIQKNVVVSFQPLQYSLLAKFYKYKRPSNFILSVGLLSIPDIVRLIIEYVFTARIKAKKDYFLDGYNIRGCINYSFLEDYLKFRSFQAYLEKYICKKLCHFKIKSFIYVFENQSWEKVCCSVLKDEKIRLVGYQSSGFSPVFLNFFPTQRDANNQPMPDIILTAGELFTKYLLEHGCYNIPVKTFSALRFSYPNDGESYIVANPNGKILNRVLYAFPVQIDQYDGIIKDLVSVFSISSITIDLKPHPIFKKTKFAKRLDLPENFNIVDAVNVDDFAGNYDLVLFNDNSFGIESLLMGVKSYQYRCSSGSNANDERFFYFDLWETHLDYDGLIALRNSLETGLYQKTFDIKEVGTYLNRMYRAYNHNPSEFLQHINTNYLNKFSK